jgi:monovalent cation:H+ antiporter, CPA1 family
MPNAKLFTARVLKFFGMTLELSQLGLLLFVSSLVAMLTRRLHMPYTVGLVLAGMALYSFAFRLTLHLSKDLIFSVFLPPLVFEAALYIRWRELKKDLPVVGSLATLGLMGAAAVTAVGMHYAVHWAWSSASVFGVLIAATDPVSVIATFKEAGVTGRLRLLVEAESLLNDGTAAVLFVLALGMVAGSGVDVLHVCTTLLLTIGGGVLCGAVTGFVLMFLAGRTSDPLVEITFTTLAAYGSFYLAEHFHFSGVLAALAAGLVAGNYGRLGYISKAGHSAVESFWDYVAFVVNSLIFLLIGSGATQQHFGALWWPGLVAILLVTLGRAVAIYPVCAFFSRSGLKVDMRHQHVLFWGGLRGALALALALGLPPDLPLRDEIVTVSFAVVAFSIFAQGLSITPLLRKLGELPASHPLPNKDSS